MLLMNLQGLPTLLIHSIILKSRNCLIMGCALGYLGLQSELQAAHKESELLRQKLKYFEEEMSRVRDRNSELVDEISSKSGKLFRIKLIT